MNPNYLRLLEGFIYYLIAVLTPLSAGFYLWAAWKDEKYDSTHAWFRAKWDAINNSAWLTLPERCIQWVLRAKGNLANLLAGLIIGGEPYVINIAIAFLLFASCWLYWGFLWALLITAAYGIFLLLLTWLAIWSIAAFAVTYSIMGSGRLSVRDRIILRVAYGLWWGYRIIGCLLIAFMWLNMLFTISLTYATVLLAILLPFSGAVAAAPIITLVERAYSKRKGELLDREYSFRFQDPIKYDPKRVIMLRVLSRHRAKEYRSLSYVIFFIFGGNAGFVLSFLAMLVGHAAEPTAYVPRLWPLLIVNFICDGLTLALTFSVLNSINKKRAYYLPLALVSTLLLSALLAFCSLYLGLLFTDHPLHAREVLNILIARAPDGNGIQLSPYFWIMHTTFIPLLLYFAVILLCWLAKVFLLGARWYFGKGLSVKDPVKITFAFCALIIGLLTALDALIRRMLT
jgi:hypothetical protein